MKIMKFKVIVWIIIIAGISLSGCNPKQGNTKAKYVFYFIGDGMGIQQIELAQAYLASKQNITGNADLSFTGFPVTGFAETYSQNRYITGSAAAGTALSTGVKTSVNTIGLSFDHRDTLYSIAYYAHNLGYSVGVATSVSIDHATPAAFYAHQPNRSMYHEIAHDMLHSGFRFFASGGFRDPDGKSDKASLGNIYDKGKSLGFYFTNELSLHDSILANYPSIVFSTPPRYPDATLKYSIDCDSSDVTLAQVTKLGIDALMNPKGFFFMVEGGKIDWACHDNDAATTVHEVIAFSDAIDVALDFYNQYPNETLIVITADHETGGMSIGNRENKYESYVSILGHQKKSLEEFNRSVKDFKGRTSGKPTFSQVFDFIALDQNLGIDQKDLSSKQQKELKEAYNASFAPQTGEQRKTNKSLYGTYDPIAVTAVRILNQNAGIGWTTYSHTASHVPIYAKGVAQSLFAGQMDNTQIPKRLAQAMGLRME